MKKQILTFLASLLIYSGVYSQAPEAVNYQAVVRDGAGAIVANQNVGIQLSVLQGSLFGTTVYQETFNPTTNTFGLVNIQIGTGTAQTGAFNTIDWGSGPYFIETAVDVTGGTNYVTISTTQFMSVPYALHAKTVDTTYLNNVINSVSTDDQNITGSLINGTDLIIGIENGTSDTVDLSSLTDADADSTNELQALSLSNDTLYLSDGNGVYIGGVSGNIISNYGPIPHWIASKGSCKDSSFNSVGNFSLSGIKEYCNFTLNSGHTLTIDGSFLLLRVTDTLKINGIINGTGTHNGTGKGGAAGGASSPLGCVQQNGSGSSVDGVALYSGGVNNVGEDADIGDVISLIDFGMSYSGLFYGGKGGNGDKASCSSAGTSAGGKGGAGIIIVCNYLDFNGSISADGQQGVFNPVCGTMGAGGGGAGIIIINAENIISNSGSTSNNGGAGGAGACSTLSGKNGYAGGDGYTVWLDAQ
jgi:trimeric autotransporter adhesin